MQLTQRDQACLDGAAGEGVAMAMRLIVRLGDAQGATHLMDVTGAHIDGCLFHGIAGLDFAERLASSGARVVVPTTLNVTSLDLLHPELYRGDDETALLAQRLVDAYVTMEATPTWTCAPYQRQRRPRFGEHVAWAESNAIVFANSVLGARTNRYGDFIDICAAVTGRVPATGLHLDAPRLATVVFDVSTVERHSWLPPVLGHLIGGMTDERVPAIVGLETASEDDLKALGAGAASSGSVAMFHAVGITPEAPDLATATGGRNVRAIMVDDTMLAAALRELSTSGARSIDAVSLGTPHASVDELRRIVALIGPATPLLPVYVNTGRETLAESGLTDALASAGVIVVTDTCTYITPILHPNVGTVMTDSAKWAYYAPGNLGVEVVFGSTEDCIASAIAGEVTPWSV
jgi:predicted aconitase